MENKTKVILGSIALGVPLLGYMAYRYALANYSFTPIGGSIVRFDKQNQKLYCNIQFELKSSIGVGFEVKDIELDILFQGVNIGQVSKKETIIVPSNGKSIITIPLELDITSIKSNIIGFATSFLTGGNLELNIVGFSKSYISGLPIGVNVDVNETFRL